MIMRVIKNERCLHVQFSKSFQRDSKILLHLKLSTSTHREAMVGKRLRSALRRGMQAMSALV